MSDPMLPLNCPQCGHPLDYVSTVDTAHIYVCGMHGEFRLDVRHSLTEANLVAPALFPRAATISIRTAISQRHTCAKAPADHDGEAS